MTSLLSTLTRTPPEAPEGMIRRRPTTVVATVGGVLTALASLVVFLAVGVIGWFASDAGVHGAPRDGMAVGALGWLMAHGSGAVVQGAAITLLPGGATLVCAWTVWRLGYRVGDLVSGHGPDADRIVDGERDWTVPITVAGFGLGYAATAAVVLAMVDGLADASVGRTVLGAGVLTLLVAAPAIAAGSGRAAIWAALLPPVVRHGAATARGVLVVFCGVAGVVLVLALVLDLGAALNVLSQLRLTLGEAVLYGALSLLLLPNAVAYAGAWLLGPGFAVGTQTLVSPTVAVIGPLPAFPLVAALPDSGTPPAWIVAAVAVPPLTAAVAAAWVQRRRPTLRWDEGAMRGCGGGIAAGVAFAVLASLSGGAAGPGRMSLLGPVALDVLVHAITAFGLGGLVGGLAMTWWQRRTAPDTDAPA